MPGGSVKNSYSLFKGELPLIARFSVCRQGDDRNVLLNFNRQYGIDNPDKGNEEDSCYDFYCIDRKMNCQVVRQYRIDIPLIVYTDSI